MSILLMSLLAVGAAACNKPKGLDEAPYVSPVPGTVYSYSGFKNIVISSDGWRVRFADEKGHKATRVGLFITDDPDTPSQIDTAALRKLWPLKNGRQTTVLMTAGTYKSRWLFKVMGQQQVAVPAGTFDTYVVQGVQRPDTVTDTKKQTVFGYTWWYAPAIAAVVKFETSYASGPSAGNSVGSILQRVDTVALKPSDTTKVKSRDSVSTRKKP